MAIDWIQVRVDRRTYALLEKVRDGMLAAHEMGRIALDFDSRGRVSLSQVIAELAYACLRHRERAKTARKRRSQGRRGDRAQQPEGIESNGTEEKPAAPAAENPEVC